ncbi:RNA polymerase sigma factor SigJ [Streptomyces luteireticuli]|uniref:RNA polymerase sigma factor SigJ n=1 Tax=Streptomyces luteireticuli TaxID=173858 RepID=A0ABP3IBF0_9ACTN
MREQVPTVERFEEERPRLRAVAYRMLGSVAEAEDAVQETWLRLERTGADGVENLGGWLTTVVARVCLNVLRSRETRREEPLEAREIHVPDPLIGPASGVDPEQQALLADSVGLAMLVVLETMSPAERVAFVLHDLFAVPFEEIAPLIDRTPAATRQLASRARRRVRDGAPAPDPDLTRQREAVDAFFAAAHDGDFDALVAVLDPDVVLRADAGAGSRFTTVLNGARTVASRALTFARLIPFARPALVNGTAGVVVVANGRPVSVMAFTVTDGRITTVDILADTDRLRSLDVGGSGGSGGQMRSAAMRR